MASTRSLQNVVNWAQGFCRNMLLSGVQGVAGEPAISIANTVLCFILGAPFAWRWNRNNTNSFTTVVGTQTYTVAAADFGWLEEASANDGTTKWGLENRLLLPDAKDSGRPTEISADYDDDNGNITFRLYPVPDAVYTVSLVYQKKPTLFTSLAGKWSPIPDEYQHLYNSGFLALAYEYIDDEKFALEYQKFIRSVIAASEGLTDSQKELFLSEKLIAMRQQENASLGPQQGRAVRGGLS